MFEVSQLYKLSLISENGKTNSESLHVWGGGFVFLHSSLDTQNISHKFLDVAKCDNFAQPRVLCNSGIKSQTSVFRHLCGTQLLYFCREMKFQEMRSSSFPEGERWSCQGENMAPRRTVLGKRQNNVSGWLSVDSPVSPGQ